MPPNHQEQTEPTAPTFDLIVVVQCESFTDPQTLNLPDTVSVPDMPELERARSMASHYGALHVNGFGAYTIRTEYGILFGRSEQELAFQQFDPYLTAKHDTVFSLP
ncbi:MAG: LTA synthase family protein, partial [Acetobacter orientalis]